MTDSNNIQTRRPLRAEDDSKAVIILKITIIVIIITVGAILRIVEVNHQNDNPQHNGPEESHVGKQVEEMEMADALLNITDHVANVTIGAPFKDD